jgi:hypothetical protein
MVKPINLFVQLLLESIDARQNLLAELPQVVRVKIFRLLDHPEQHSIGVINNKYTL